MSNTTNILEMSAIPIEVLEEVFKNLGTTSIRQCRLVCKAWNKEIVTHTDLGLRIFETSHGNLEFVRSVQRPSTLRIFKLNPTSSQQLINTSNSIRLANVKILSCEFIPAPGHGLDFRFWSNSCAQLTSLQIYRSLLSTCELESANNGNGYIDQCSLFPCLQSLCIEQNESYYPRISGRSVQLLSKNITFLLRSIASCSVKVLYLSVNAEFSDINSCTAREGYRYEDRDLRSFICRQSGLKKMILTIPMGVNNYIGSYHSLKYPLGLKHMRVANIIGVRGIDENVQMLEFRELLSRNEAIYQDIRVQPQNALLWRDFLQAQYQLESLNFVDESVFGSADIVLCLCNNNRRILKLSLETCLTGTINCALIIHKELLTKLVIKNRIFDIFEEHGTGDCRMTNLLHLPKSITTLELLNVYLDPLDVIDGISKLPQLKKLRLLYERHHSFSNVPAVFQILSSLACQRNLNELIVGYYGYSELVLLGELGMLDWGDEEGRSLSF